MADDAQFDPLAGILTPQQLQLMRIQQMQQAMAQANGPGVDGLQAAAKSTGLALGSGLGNYGPDTSLAGQIAQQNQAILGAPPPDQGGGPASQDPYEARAQAYEQKAKMFLQAGQYDTAQKFINAAQIVRKQSADIEKARADTYQAYGKGMDARANMNDVKPTLRPDGTYGYTSVPKVGGPATPITGADAPPPAPVATVDLRGALPGFDRTLDLMKQYKVSADQATVGMARTQQMGDLLSGGKMITGTGADARLGFNNMLASIGFSQAKDATANTLAYLNDAKAQALSLRPPSMQRLTNADLKFLNDLSAGNIEWNSAALKRVVEVQKRTFTAAIDTYNNQRKSALAATYEPGLDKNVAISMRAGIKSLGEPGALPPQPAAPAGAGPVQITSDADYEALPNGATYKAPDGSTRTKGKK